MTGEALASRLLLARISQKPVGRHHRFRCEYDPYVFTTNYFVCISGKKLNNNTYIDDRNHYLQRIYFSHFCKQNLKKKITVHVVKFKFFCGNAKPVHNYVIGCLSTI